MARRKAEAAEVAPEVTERETLAANAAIPIYHMTRGRDAAIAQPDPGSPGKVIHLVQPEEQLNREKWQTGVGDRDELLAALTDCDVLWVPLHHSQTCGRIEVWPAPCEEFYDDALSFLRDAAPLVKAVLYGNMGSEFCWFIRGGHRFNPLALDCARHVCDLVEDAGGRPAFGTVDWDLLVDCYRGDGQLAALMHERNALQVCYCGYTLVQGSHCDRAHHLYAEQRPFMSANGDKDGSKLREYLGPIEVWSGLNFIDGLRAGNDRLLRDAGFKGGMMG